MALGSVSSWPDRTNASVRKQRAVGSTDPRCRWLPPSRRRTGTGRHLRGRSRFLRSYRSTRRTDSLLVVQKKDLQQSKQDGRPGRAPHTHTLTGAAGLSLPAAAAFAVEVVDQISTQASVVAGSRTAVVHVCGEKNKTINVTTRRRRRPTHTQESRRGGGGRRKRSTHCFGRWRRPSRRHRCTGTDGLCRCRCLRSGRGRPRSRLCLRETVCVTDHKSEIWRIHLAEH